MRVDNADYLDIRHWLDLASEVEPLFGPLLNDPEFYRALLRNIERGTAHCVRLNDGPPGSSLLGAMLFSPPNATRHTYRIGWLAVATQSRQQGVGSLLVEHACKLAQPPTTLEVVTFGEENEPGRPARRLYERHGFQPAEAAPPGPEGGSRQVFRRTIT